jgi:hypothetical protein
MEEEVSHFGRHFYNVSFDARLGNLLAIFRPEFGDGRSS